MRGGGYIIPVAAPARVWIIVKTNVGVAIVVK